MVEFEYGDGKKQVVLDKLTGNFIINLLENPIYAKQFGFDEGMSKEQIDSLIDMIGATCVPPRSREDILGMEATDFLDFLGKILPHLENFMKTLAIKFPENLETDITQ